ncbi:MAG: hypothetical protein EOP85_11990, partial [Verrucomicrobiaceae bacterium]
MKNWTTQAEQRLAEYLKERTAREGFEGEDAAELKDDLTRHIHEEAEQSEGETVGLMQLENLLGRLDAGYCPPPEKPVADQKKAGALGFWTWTFGVFLPIGVLILEMFTSLCGGIFFNPTPTWWHAAWIALVPGLNAWLIRGGKGGSAVQRGLAAGFGTMTATFFALLFLPIIHLSFFAVIFYGIGLLSLSPILAALVSWKISKVTGRDTPDRRGFGRGWKTGAVATVMVLLALEGPSLWTRVNLATALSGDEQSEPAISRLRAFHSERSLLNACYERESGLGKATDISGWLVQTFTNPLAFFGAGDTDGAGSESRRDVYFRVTGKAITAVKPP